MGAAGCTQKPMQIDLEFDNQWKELASHQTPWIRDKIIKIKGTSTFWYSTDYNEGERGMVEYNYKSNTISTIAKYPHHIQPEHHSCCKYKNNIYIIDGVNGEIILFKPSIKSFIKQTMIPKLGTNTSCATIGNTIHIMGGNKNTNLEHIIYSIKTNCIEIIEDPTSETTTYSINLLSYKDRIIRFGGFDTENKQCIGKFFVSSAIKDNDNDNDIKWTLKRLYKLKYGVSGNGYIVYDHYIIIFGGEPAVGIFTDDIWILDLHTGHGWINKKNIKCPLKSNYRAVLDDDDEIHLFTTVNSKQNVIRHFAIDIRQIFGHDDDGVDVKYNDNDELRKQCDIFNEENQRLKMLVARLQRENNELLSKNKVLEEEVDGYKRTQRISKKNDCEILTVEYQTEKEQLSSENEELRKQLSLTQSEIKQQSKELEKMRRVQNLDTSKYWLWTSQELADWITSIKNNQYSKYESKLRQKINVTGSAMETIEEKDLENWGIESSIDRAVLFRNIQLLVNDRQSNYNTNLSTPGVLTPYYGDRLTLNSNHSTISVNSYNYTYKTIDDNSTQRTNTPTPVNGKHESPTPNYNEDEENEFAVDYSF